MQLGEYCHILKAHSHYVEGIQVFWRLTFYRRYSGSRRQEGSECFRLQGRGLGKAFFLDVATIECEGTHPVTRRRVPEHQNPLNLL